jgi:hypothetical protein
VQDHRRAITHGLVQFGQDGIDGIGDHDIPIQLRSKGRPDGHHAQVIAATGRAYYILRVLTRNMTVLISTSYLVLYQSPRLSHLHLQSCYDGKLIRLRNSGCILYSLGEILSRVFTSRLLL